MKFISRMISCLTLIGVCLCSALAQKEAPQPTAAETAAMSKQVALVNAMVKELLIVKSDKVQGQLAIWLPYDFFYQSALADSSKSIEENEKQIAAIKDYQVIIVECKSSSLDGTLMQGEVAIRSRANIKMADGTMINPLEKIPESIVQPVSAIQAAMAGAGEDANNMHVLLFPAKTGAGKLLIDTSKREKFSLVLKADKSFSETTFTWRTPFDALNPPQPCTKCHEILSAKWDFCPWCGTKQEEKK